MPYPGYFRPLNEMHDRQDEESYAVEDLERAIHDGEALPCRFCEGCDDAPCERRIDAHTDALREAAEDARVDQYISQSIWEEQHEAWF